MKWELGALRILARNETVPGVALRDTIGEIDKLVSKLNDVRNELGELKATLTDERAARDRDIKMALGLYEENKRLREALTEQETAFKDVRDVLYTFGIHCHPRNDDGMYYIGNDILDRLGKIYDRLEALKGGKND